MKDVSPATNRRVIPSRAGHFGGYRSKVNCRVAVAPGGVEKPFDSHIESLILLFTIPTSFLRDIVYRFNHDPDTAALDDVLGISW